MKYCATNLPEEVKMNDQLDEHQQSLLLELLEKHKELFDGTVGKWKGRKVGID